jgi:hypothetical protein
MLANMLKASTKEQNKNPSYKKKEKNKILAKQENKRKGKALCTEVSPSGNDKNETNSISSTKCMNL